jgi:hypothetical protein
MRLFDSPYFEPPHVELTDERERHIQRRHPDLLPDHVSAIGATLAEPDMTVPNPFRSGKVAVGKWFPTIRGGKFVIVQVVTDPGNPPRHWVVTAYLDSVPPA